MQVFFFLILNCFIFPVFSGAQEVKVLTLREALDLSQKYNPDVKAAGARESQAEGQKRVEQSTYFPHLSLEALDSTGFPGSTGALGIQGLMGSPFRSGLGAGAALTQDLFDFGRTQASVRAAEYVLKERNQQIDIERFRTNQEVISAFFSCVLSRLAFESWTELAKDSELVDHEVETFVQTGQRSIVDRYLARAQEEDAKTNVDDFQERLKISQQRLSVITGYKEAFECAMPANDSSTELKLSPNENSIVAFAQFRLGEAQAILDYSKAENLPKLVGIASFGYLQDAHLVPVTNYSLGIGIQFPIFEGFRVKGEIEKNSALVQEREFQIQATQFGLDDLNQQYDERIGSAHVRTVHLSTELKIANQAFDIAKKRYFQMKGNLIDVRDSLSNLARVKNSLNNARVEYSEYQALKLNLNGAR